jgi:hypothetical protein
MYWLRILAATAAAAAFGFTFHVLYGQGIAEDYMNTAREAGRLMGMIQEPYPTYIVVIAGGTAVLPTLGKVITWLLVRSNLPGKTTLVKALWFTALMIFAGDNFLRLPIMNFLIGMPIDVWFVYSAEMWIIVPAMCLLIAFISPPPQNRAPQ